MQQSRSCFGASFSEDLFSLRGRGVGFGNLGGSFGISDRAPSQGCSNSIAVGGAYVLGGSKSWTSESKDKYSIEYVSSTEAIEFGRGAYGGPFVTCTFRIWR